MADRMLEVGGQFAESLTEPIRQKDRIVAKPVRPSRRERDRTFARALSDVDDDTRWIGENADADKSGRAIMGGGHF